MKIEINIPNKVFYALMALIVVILIGTGVYAVSGVSHTADEIQEIDPTVNLAKLKTLVSNDFHNLGGTDAVDDADASVTNEIQTLSLSGNTLTLSNGGDSVTLPSGFWTKTGNDIYYTAGKVGIGKTDPKAKLDVDGEVKVKGVKPILIRRFENQGNDANFNTLISKDDYYCVATGWSAKWDFQESGSLPNMVWTYTKADSNTWWARVEFASHNNHENTDVDILCFRKELAEWGGYSSNLNDPD